jgi:DNA polymerase zeta
VRSALSRLFRITTLPSCRSHRRNSLDAEHYIDASCRAVGRILNLVGVDVWTWKADMPKTIRPIARINDNSKQPKIRIDEHFKSEECMICGSKSKLGTSKGHQEKRPRTQFSLTLPCIDICLDCRSKPSETSYALLSRIRTAEQRRNDLQRVCASCSQHPAYDKIECVSTDCPVFYSRQVPFRPAHLCVKKCGSDRLVHRVKANQAAEEAKSFSTMLDSLF